MNHPPREFDEQFLSMLRHGAYAPAYSIHTDEHRPGLGEIVIRRIGMDVEAWRLRPHSPVSQPGFVYGEPIDVVLVPRVVGGDDR
ncbi:hypothetical protein SEA_JUNG_65 [Mycobacterium phage Jung]|uniref:Uncharacterized protein n=1 Tax=Mycobacterium phage Jung TaxID=2742107 RepID=A0AAE7K7C5_9CAUD|nr:hypothetical protein I5J41_gp65 [Mycobacterium phage Jung]QKY80221.1 hypothetical protein SEA_JUNG_65 [Mycobacterium phage Jung]